ncbi:hypothetical protein [Neptuniibacter halophilus]|uniref:hypothetical protein n=1 Tax=Neptuniibacter halophilus TaxID=651666 RepID=UPI002572F21F|nr:hypothetical protein [Neptuniibacter halophilus]
MSNANNKIIHHLAVAVGFIGLLAWFYAGRQLGFLDWITLQMPAKYAGSGLMLGIMILMTPGFFIWARYNRWVEKRLQIKGIYYEDSYYKDDEKLKQAKRNKPS